jgi:hypothetical protein
MKKMRLPLLAAALVGPCVFPQEVPKPTGETVELSPFIVATTVERGYLATNTLAGTRLNTELKDVGAAVSVYTPEFLEDIAATTLENILTYTTATEGGGISGNFAGFTGEFSDEARDNPAGINRVRGLAAATRSRNYFATDIPSDTYNFSNLTVSRGPNAILAGNGSAGGIIDAALNKALFKDSYQVKVRAGKHESLREELHLNKVLIDKVLAFRLDALNKKDQFRQKPTYEQDRRIYLGVALKLREPKRDAFLGGTTIRADTEFGTVKGTPPDMLTPLLSVQSWFDGIDPRNGNPWAAPKWRVNGAQQIISNANGVTVPATSVIAGFPLFRNWGLIYADPVSGQAGVGFTDPALAPIQGFMGTLPTGSAGPGGYVRGTGDQNRTRAGYTWTRLIDRNMFDFYNQLMTGVFDHRSQHFNATDLRLEQLLWDGKAGFEIAYNRQDFERKRDFPISGNENQIFIDTTEYLSVRTDAYPGGSIASQLIKNPNFGRPFIVSRDAFRDQVNTSFREGAQVTAFLQHDFTKARSRFGRLLGRHTLSGLYFENDITKSNRTYISTWDPKGQLNPATSIGAAPGAFASQVNAWFYLGPSMVNAARPEDMRLQAISAQRPKYGDTYTLRIFDPATGKFVTGTSTPLRVLGTIRDQKEKVSSDALALQSHWLGDHVTTLVGRRKDESKAFTSADPIRLSDGNLDVSNLTLQPASSQSKASWTKSVVARYPEKLVGPLPLGADLRGFWNQSDNFSPVGQRRNIWNEELGSPSAKTKEYGVMLALFRGKLDIRATKFETAITADAISGVGNPYGYINTLITRMMAAYNLGLRPADYGYTYGGFTTFADVAKAFYATIPQDLAKRMGPQFNFDPHFEGSGSNVNWQPDTIEGLASISDTISKGIEIDLVCNPTPGWRISANVAKTEAFKANVARQELSFVAAWRTNLETMYAGNLLQGWRNPPSENGLAWAQYQTETVAAIQTANALSGTSTPEIRKWRANLVTRYEFQRGFLRGFRLGSALRWQDKIAIGYPYVRDSQGNDVADLTRPYFGPDSLLVDFSCGYRTRLKIFDQGLECDFALNLMNVFANDRLIPIVANADGGYGTIRIPPERGWAVTASFRY